MSEPVVIAVMGVTGTGKSQFIEVLTGEETGIGDGLASQTAEVKDYTMDVGGREVILLDTPGFNDTYNSDAKILESIMAWLTVSDRKATWLSGLIYLHRITDERMTGTMVMNLDMVQKLCGDRGAKNIVLTSTRWEEASEGSQGYTRFLEREGQLINGYWKFIRNCGATTARYSNSRESGLAIINQIIRDNAPIRMQAQEEMEKPGATMKSTSAGRVLEESSIASQGRDKDFMANLTTMMNNILSSALQHVAQEQQKILEQMRQQYENNARQMQEFWQSHNARLERRVAELEGRVANKRCVIL